MYRNGGAQDWPGKATAKPFSEDVLSEDMIGGVSLAKGTVNCNFVVPHTTYPVCPSNSSNNAAASSLSRFYMYARASQHQVCANNTLVPQQQVALHTHTHTHLQSSQLQLHQQLQSHPHLHAHLRDMYSHTTHANTHPQLHTQTQTHTCDNANVHNNKCDVSPAGVCVSTTDKTSLLDAYNTQHEKKNKMTKVSAYMKEYTLGNVSTSLISNKTILNDSYVHETNPDDNNNSNNNNNSQNGYTTNASTSNNTTTSPTNTYEAKRNPQVDVSDTNNTHTHVMSENNTHMQAHTYSRGRRSGKSLYTSNSKYAAKPLRGKGIRFSINNKHNKKTNDNNNNNHNNNDCNDNHDNNDNVNRQNCDVPKSHFVCDHDKSMTAQESQSDDSSAATHTHTHTSSIFSENKKGENYSDSKDTFTRFKTPHTGVRGQKRRQRIRRSKSDDDSDSHSHTFAHTHTHNAHTLHTHTLYVNKKQRTTPLYEQQHDDAVTIHQSGNNNNTHNIDDDNTCVSTIEDFISFNNTKSFLHTKKKIDKKHVTKLESKSVLHRHKNTSTRSSLYSALKGSKTDVPTEEQKKRHERMKRFESTTQSNNSVTVESNGSGSLDDMAALMSMYIRPHTQALVGRNTQLLKPYLRLTGPPDPSLVRPDNILQNAFAHICTLWINGTKDYRFIDEQLRSIRQDLSVQRIKSLFTIKVYEFNAKLALNNDDLGQFNQCQTQLKELYKLNAVDVHNSNKAQFTSYRMLYMALLNLRLDLLKLCGELSEKERAHHLIRHASAIRKALAESNYHLYFKLIQHAPDPFMKLLAAFFAERLRVSYLLLLTKGSYSMSLAHITKELAFVDEHKCLAFLNEHNCTWDQKALLTDNNFVLDCRKSASVLEKSSLLQKRKQKALG